MPIPDTKSDLESFGYVWLNDSHCRGCGAPIQWWKTPRKNRIPFSVQQDGKMIPHFADCPKADQFRKSQ